MSFTPDELWAALSDDEKAAAIAAAKSPRPALAAVPDPPAAAVEGTVEDAGDGYAELGEFLDDTLRLSVGGVHYDVPAAGIDDGLYCQRVLSVSASAATGREITDKQKDELSDEEEADLFRRLLGEELMARLRADGRSWSMVRHMGTTAMFWAAMGREMALTYWKTEGRDPKEAPAAPRQPADRLPAKATANGIPKRASTTSTSPKKTAAKRTPGRTS